MLRLLLLLPLCLLLAPESPRRPRTTRAAAPREKVDVDADMQRLASGDPVAFLEACIARSEREVTGYTALLVKQERIGGTLQPEEWLRCWFREGPTFRVLMEWEKGQRLAHRTLYVKGENGGLLLVKPTGLLGTFGTARRDPEGADARASARYPATGFGIHLGMGRTLAAWKAARERGRLRVACNGLKTPPELGYPCWEVVRTGYEGPEDGGVSAATWYFDPKTWLQVGSVLRDADGQLVGRYLWTEVKLNAEIPDETFTEKALWR